MGKSQLTKYEALELITPVVDDEACKEKRRAFFDFIEKNDDVRRKYESAKNIKSLMQSRCPSSRAPESLRSGIQKLLQENNL